MDIAKAIVTELKKKKVISDEEYNIYVYGMEILLLKCVAFIIALGLSIILQTTEFLFLLLLFLVPIRKYAGGAHASSKEACLFLTEMILVIAQIAWKYGIGKEMFQTCSVTIGLLMVILFSPAESKKRRLTMLKRKSFRIRSILFGCINVLCYSVACVFGCDIVKSAVSVAMMIEATLIVLQKVLKEHE